MGTVAQGTRGTLEPTAKPRFGLKGKSAPPPRQARVRPRLAVTVLGMLDPNGSLTEDPLLTELLAQECPLPTPSAASDVVETPFRERPAQPAIAVGPELATWSEPTPTERAIETPAPATPLGEVPTPSVVEVTRVVAPPEPPSIPPAAVPAPRLGPSIRRRAPRPSTLPGWPTAGELQAERIREREGTTQVVEAPRTGATYTVGLRPAVAIDPDPVAFTPYRHS